MKTIRKILDLDVDEVIKKEEEKFNFITYKTKDDDPVTKVLNMKKVPTQENIIFQFVEISDSGSANSDPVQVVMSFDEVRNLQLLLEYSVPALMGWHALYDTGVVESSLASSRSN